MTEGLDAAMRQFTAPPRRGLKASELTDRDRVALCIAAGVPVEFIQNGSMLTCRTTKPVAVCERGDGTYLVAVAA